MHKHEAVVWPEQNSEGGADPGEMGPWSQHKKVNDAHTAAIWHL